MLDETIRELKENNTANIPLLLSSILVGIAVFLLYRYVRRSRRGLGTNAQRAVTHRNEPYPAPPPQVYTQARIIVPPVPVRAAVERPELRPPLPPLMPEKQVHLRSFRASRSEYEQPCAICLEVLQGSYVSSGTCGHVMHTACLSGWLAKDINEACPICRAPYMDSEEQSIGAGW